MNFLAAGFPPYFDHNVFQSHWQLTQRCNFHCEYCVNQHLRQEGIFMPKELMLHALEKISNLKRDRFHFCLSGGEVTLYPYLNEMLQAISSSFPHKTSVTLMSNGSASAERMRTLLSANPELTCRFVITVHLGQTRIEQLAEKLDSFSRDELRAYFNVKIIMAPGDRRGIEAARTLDAADIHIYDLLPVLDFETGRLKPGYSREEMEMFTPRDHKPWFYFRHYTEDGYRDVTYVQGIEENLFHYKGMLCAAGMQSIFIEEHGRVSRGQFCGKMPYTIMDKNPFENPEFLGPTACRENHCTCIPFTALPKWSDPSYAPKSCKGKK